jgi:hypothetical protein
MLLAFSRVDAAVMNVHYEGYYLDTSAIWGTGTVTQPPAKPAGTIDTRSEYGSLLSSTPTRNDLDVWSNSAWSQTGSYSDHRSDRLHISLQSNLDDDIPFSITGVVSDPQHNYARSTWNALFSISDGDANFSRYGYFRNTAFWTNEIYLFDLTDLTVNRFGHPTDGLSQTLLDGHLYALSAISSQQEMGLDDALDTGFLISDISINLLSDSGMGKPMTSLFTDLDDVRRTYSRYIGLAEPTSLLLLGAGLLGLIRVRCLPPRQSEGGWAC